MATRNCPSLGPRDNLRYDDLVLVPTGGNSLVFKVVLAALAALLVVILGSLPIGQPDQAAPRERVAVPTIVPGAAPPPAIALDHRSTADSAAP